MYHKEVHKKMNKKRENEIDIEQYKLKKASKVQNEKKEIENKKHKRIKNQNIENKALKKQEEIEKTDENKEKRKISYKKKMATICIFMVAIITIIIVVVYNANSSFRDFMDKYILRKNVTEENVPIIEVDYNSNTNIIPYGKYICVLAENTLFKYNQAGKKEHEVKIEISNPIYHVEGKYLTIGEKNNQKLYLISGEHIKWRKEK